MAQRYVTDSGVLVVPGAYPEVKVQKNNSGLATSGVIFLVGEADAGPDFSLEDELALEFYAPDQMSDVLQKYKSGNLVDAFRAAANPANDTNIAGSPAAIYCIKTNVSTQASGALARAGLTNYGTLADLSYGALGNMIYAQVLADTAEVAPTTGPFTYIPGPDVASDGETLAVRVNGGAVQTASIAALASPSTLVTSLNALSGVYATGGENRGVLAGISLASTLAVAVSGNNVTITTNATWATTPSVGDTLVIPLSGEYGAGSDSVIKGAASANAGAYVVTAATTTTISATKLKDDLTTGITPPAAVSAIALTTERTSVICYSPITIKNATGTNRNVLTGLTTKTVTGSASGSSLTLTLQTGSAWAALAQVGDLVQIPSTAPAAWLASGSNTGWYTVTAATTGTAAAASTITMTRLSNGSPASFVATAIAAVTDLVVLRPAIDGTGKALALYDGGGNINVSTNFFNLSTTAVTWLSTSGSPYLLTSASEYVAELDLTRQADGSSEEYVAGGDVAMKLGYVGTTGTVTISSTTLTTTVTGGSGANLSITLSGFAKLSDLVQYINSQTGYTCSLGSAIMGQLPVSALDLGTYSIGTTHSSQPGRVKKDAYDFFKKLSQGSALVQLGVTTAAKADAGLPEVQAITYLSGGAKGGTTAAQALAAITALEGLRGNFVVPLFSRDASEDIADGLTESSSTYLVDDVNAAVSSHVIAMSKLKRRRHRQAFVSKKGSFNECKLAAQNIANYRVAMTFQDVKTLSGAGVVTQYQPWMGAVFAAGMQAAGFYRAIVFKGINCSGVLQADGTFADSDDSDLEAAIENGLLAAQRPDTGGVRWNSDQTTYATDESFVYNSVQAIYASDVIALTVAQRMERAFVGQSVADVSASVALSYLQGIMADIKRLKLIAASDDAPLGYKNARITISGSAMRVEVEIKLAGAILFIPITFLVTQVQQTAAA